MDEILAYAYSDVIVAAPYVIGAYVLIWVALLIFVIIMLNSSKKTQSDIDALREAIERREKEQK
ncbi:MAG: hypothetical protein IKE43_05030 [Coriobacteriales bacterium]|nr:hypothetical protein [Coriobacteriales bacterium]